MERIAYLILLLFVIAWIIGLIVGMVAIFPYGMVGLLLIIGIGLLFIKVLKDRLSNREDDYYSRNIDK